MPAPQWQAPSHSAAPRSPWPEATHPASVPAAPGPQSAGEAEASVGLTEFADILRRRWRLIALTTVAITGLGIAFSIVAKPQFTASTLIFVDPRNRPSFQIEGTGIGGAYDPNLVDSQIVVIESDAVLRRVIQSERLLQDAEFTRGPGGPDFNAMRNLKEAVKVKRPDRTYVVEVQVRTESGEKSARLANAIAGAYLSDGRESKNETAARESSWLDRHLQNLQDRLKEAEARVEAYKVENKILGVEGRLVGEQQLSELNRGIVDAQRRAAEARAVLDQVEALRRSGRLPDATNEALRSGAIERLRTQLTEVLRLDANARSTLGPRHPAAIEIREQLAEIRRQINEELGRIAEGARSGFQVANANVQSLQRQLDGLKRDANATNATLLRLRELERAVEAQKAVYEKFLRDKEQIARLTVDTPAGRVIAPANVPQVRSFPNRPLIVSIAFVLGLFAGIGLALLIETIQRARGPRPSGQAPRRGAEPAFAPSSTAWMPPPAVLANLPGPKSRKAGGLFSLSRLGGKGGEPAPMPTLDAYIREPESAFSQEIRVWAQRLAPRIQGRDSVSLLLSGVEAGASNPALASNLALALVESGFPVLLVDGTGQETGLTSQLPSPLETIEIDVAGRPMLAKALMSHGKTTLAFLPFGGVSGPMSGTLRRAGSCPVLLIDGPSVGSPDLDRFELQGAVDGVIAVLPPGLDPASALLETTRRRFGAALVGVVGQAA
jgi:uncharacterized protein involved in exopolysaccharide biosynthesis